MNILKNISLAGLETIDDELNDIGIAFVQTDNEDYPFRVHAIETFPAVGLYRNGEFLQYTGDNLNDEEEIRKVRVTFFHKF